MMFKGKCMATLVYSSRTSISTDDLDSESEEGVSVTCISVTGVKIPKIKLNTDNDAYTSLTVVFLATYGSYVGVGSVTINGSTTKCTGTDNKFLLLNDSKTAEGVILTDPVTSITKTVSITIKIVNTNQSKVYMT